MLVFNFAIQIIIKMRLLKNALDAKKFAKLALLQMKYADLVLLLNFCSLKMVLVWIIVLAHMHKIMYPILVTYANL